MKYDYRKNIYGSIIPPIKDNDGEEVYLGVAYGFSSTEEGKKIFGGSQKGFAYSRIGNPTVRKLEEAILAGEAEGLEGYDAIATNTGMSAIALAIFHLAADSSVVKNFVVSPAVYGGTFDLCAHWIKKFKIEARIVKDPHNIDAWKKLIDENTAFIYIETPANPQLKTFDIRAFADLAHSCDTLLVIDNTICTFVGQQPLKLGADMVVLSTTKSMNGYCNALGGAIVAKEKYINGDPKDDGDLGIRFGLAIDLGTVMEAGAASRTMKGMKSLKSRIKISSENAITLAYMLDAQKKVKKIYYPFPINEEPVDDYVMSQMKYGGCLLGFELNGTYSDARTFIDTIAKNSSCIFHGPHLGGHMTMISHPASTTHARVEKDTMEMLGISPTFIRVSAGIEEEKDLKEVLDAFESAFLKI